MTFPIIMLTMGIAKLIFITLMVVILGTWSPQMIP